MITFTETGSVVIHIPGRVHPKGSFRAIPGKNGACPVCHRGFPVLVENDDHRAESKKIVKALTAEWGERAMLTGPVRYSAIYTFVKPKTSKDPYPYHVGDIDKLQRRVLDWLAGNVKAPGPILANDNLIVSTGQHQKEWGAAEGVTVKLTPLGLGVL